MQKILFVCTGNICRSPTAEGVLRHRLRALKKQGIEVDSAGTHAYHISEAPDPRSVAAAKKRGVMLKDLRARKVTPEDFHIFDLILALDYDHLQHLQRMAPGDAKAHTALFLEYAGHKEKEVPDPYYGEAWDFEYVLDLIEEGVEPLIGKLEQP